MTARFESAAAELRQQELARLADFVPPTLANLRSLTSGDLRAAVALMLERLGYAVLTDPTANDLTATKDGRKYLIACGATRRHSQPIDFQHIAEIALQINGFESTQNHLFLHHKSLISKLPPLIEKIPSRPPNIRQYDRPRRCPPEGRGKGSRKPNRRRFFCRPLHKG